MSTTGVNHLTVFAETKYKFVIKIIVRQLISHFFHKCFISFRRWEMANIARENMNFIVEYSIRIYNRITSYNVCYTKLLRRFDDDSNLEVKSGNHFRCVYELMDSNRFQINSGSGTLTGLFFTYKNQSVFI